MPNVLEQISGLCDSGYTSDPRTNQQLYSIKKIAGRNPSSEVSYCSFAYSALASFRMGMSGVGAGNSAVIEVPSTARENRPHLTGPW